MTLSHIRIGVDVGETHIMGIALAPDNEVLAEVQADKPQDDYDATLIAIADIVTNLERSANGGTASVGVGLPGSVVPKTGILQNVRQGYLDQRPVRDDLTKLLRRLVRCVS
ncbi:MAG: ROK family protein, partial [Alphaproteobacteria bacterium]|nr:ROK family protein [Alphaproteobacteria bacterium]